MKATRKISTLRANGFSFVNCSGNVCRIASLVPFLYGDKRVDERASQGDYRLDVRGHWTKELPKEVSLLGVEK